MSREDLKNQMLGMKDIQKRWGYKDISSVRRRRMHDEKFPMELTRINGHHLVFLLSEIEEYEKHRPHLLEFDEFSSYARKTVYYQTKEEWLKMTEQEKLERGGCKPEK